MVKNYLVITTTGKAMYSTSVKVYKLVRNKPVLLGELRGQSEDNPTRYLSEILNKGRKKKIDVSELQRLDKINLHEIKL